MTKGLVRIAAAVAGGLLVAGAFPPLDLPWLAWIGMMPFLWALWSIRGKWAGWKGFGIGTLGGLAACLIQFNWVSSVSWLGAIVLPAYLALYWGLFGIFAAKIGNPWKAGRSGNILTIALCHGAVWAGCELLRGWVITGISWNVLGVALHDLPVMAQAADLLGVVGLSMLLVFFQAVVVQAAMSRRWRPLALAAGVMVMIAGYGVARIHGEKGRESVRLKTLLVQLNIPQEAARMLWSALETHQGYEDETRKALEGLKTADGVAADWPDWVMWPEIALTGWVLDPGDGRKGMYQVNWDTVSRVREEGPFSLIFGTAETDAEHDGERLIPKADGNSYNSLAVIPPDEEIQTYRKEHLIIFGETIPLLDTFPFLKKIYEEQSGAEYHGSFTAGNRFEPLPMAVGNNQVGAIPTVCFEDSVPRLMRRFVRPGSQVIINVTNDGWFKQSAAARQHFDYARFRAIEFRRPMLRCANTGVSAAISTTGSTANPDTGLSQILTDASGSHFTRGSLLTELDVPLKPSFSLYAVIGDWGITVLALLGWVLPGRLQGRREGNEIA